MDVETDIEAWRALDPLRWQGVAADARALVTAARVRRMRDEGHTGPHPALAARLGVTTKVVSRAVDRSTEVRADPERLADASAIAAAAGYDGEDLWGRGTAAGG